MLNPAREASGAPFRSLQDSNNPTATWKRLQTSVILLASISAFAGLVALWFWPTPSEPPLTDVQFPKPASLEHANQLLLKLPPVEQVEEQYNSFVLPHLLMMYHQFLDSYGSTAPQLLKVMGTSLPVHVLEGEEFNRRLNIFGENVKQIMRMNSQTSGGGPDRAIFAINVFADWSKEEMSSLTTVHLAIPSAPMRSEHTSNSSAHRMKREDCEDRGEVSNCEYWQRAGYCEESSEYSTYMHTNCMKTCGTCVACEDAVDSDDCDYWKGLGYCESTSQYYNYLQTNCQKTCAFCGQGDPCDCSSCWSSLPGKYLGGYTSRGGQCFDLVDAMALCEEDSSCHGVNKQYDECGGNKWTLRYGSTGYTADGYDATNLESKLLDRTCMTRCNANCDDNDGTSRNWAVEYPDAFEVRHQGSCGSCWAHSTAEMMRQHWSIKQLGSADTGLLSVQMLVDCVKPYSESGACGNMGVGGCCGGWPWKALAYIHERGGIPTQANYGSYHGGDDRFQYHTCKQAPSVMTTLGPKYLDDEQAMKTAILQEGSAGITIYAGAFHSYAGGIFPASACGTESMNHAVQLVGYIDEKQAWLVQNSWGHEWGVSRNPPYNYVSGQSGFILLQYGANTCNIAQVRAVQPDGVSRPQSTKQDVQVPPPRPKAAVLL